MHENSSADLSDKGISYLKQIMSRFAPKRLEKKKNIKIQRGLCIRQRLFSLFLFSFAKNIPPSFLRVIVVAGELVSIIDILFDHGYCRLSRNMGCAFASMLRHMIERNLGHSAEWRPAFPSTRVSFFIQRDRRKMECQAGFPAQTSN